MCKHRLHDSQQKKRSRSRILEDTLFQKVALMFQCVQIITKCCQMCYLQRNQIDVGGQRTGNLLGCISILIDVAKDFITVHQDFCCYDRIIKLKKYIAKGI